MDANNRRHTGRLTWEHAQRAVRSPGVVLRAREEGNLPCAAMESMPIEMYADVKYGPLLLGRQADVALMLAQFSAEALLRM